MQPLSETPAPKWRMDRSQSLGLLDTSGVFAKGFRGLGVVGCYGMGVLRLGLLGSQRLTVLGCVASM